MVNRLSLSLVLVLLTSAAAAFGQESSRLGEEDGPVRIAWEAVSGAAAYRVEVRRDGGVFIDTETLETELKLDLAPGSYEYRIRVLNPFGGEAAASAWLTLKVERARTPYFRVARPLVVWEGDESLEMGLDVVETKDRLEFVFARNGSVIPAETRISEGLVFVQVDTAGMEPGGWNLVATAPSGLSYTHPDALVIRPTRPPEVESLDTVEVPNEGLVPIVIEGQSFDDEMTVAFKGPGGYLEVATVEITDSGTEARVYINAEGAPAGTYDLIISNPGGEETRKNGLLTVTEPEEAEKEKIQPRFEFHLGWAPLLIDSPAEDLVGIAAFETALAFHSGWKTPFFNGLGLEARGLFGLTGPTQDSDQAMEYIIQADVSGYWRPPVRGRWAPVLLIGFGNMWSGYAAYFGLPNMLYLRTGFAVDYARFSNFTRIGLNYMWAYGSDESVPIVSVMFRRGFRF